jgi:hypothetical protein
MLAYSVVLQSHIVSGTMLSAAQLGDELLIMPTLDDAPDASAASMDDPDKRGMLLEPLVPKLPDFDFDAGLNMCNLCIPCLLNLS